MVVHILQHMEFEYRWIILYQFSETWLMNDLLVKIYETLGIEFDSLPWDIADWHPIAIFVLVTWNIFRTVQIHELGLVHEIYHSLCSIVSLKLFTNDIKFMRLYVYIYIYHKLTRTLKLLYFNVWMQIYHSSWTHKYNLSNDKDSRVSNILYVLIYISRTSSI